MSNTEQKQNNAVATKTTENIPIESLLNSSLVKNLASSLKLNDVQLAKANKAVLDMMNDENLKGTTQISKVRFAYNVATLNYKNPNAVAGIKYETAIQAQLQYQALIEDMIACGGLKDNKVIHCFLYKGVDYKPTMVGDYIILTLPDHIEVQDMFTKPEVVGFYCEVDTKDYGKITSVMSIDQFKAWASRYSKAYKADKFSPYKTNFNDMGLKTVIKIVGRAVLKLYPFDRLAQSINLDFAVFDDEGVSYNDNPQPEEEKPIEKGEVRNEIKMPDVVGEAKE